MNNATPGLYVHIPFCQSKCIYCSFYSIPVRIFDINRYYTALCLQIRQAAAVFPWNSWHYASVFFGGGTPSILPVDMLCALLEKLQQTLPIDNEAEISIEINPATIDLKGLIKLRKAGFNRVSIGCQSFSDADLQLLGRRYSAQKAGAACGKARRAGFDNVSLDCMYGLPGQTWRQWGKTLEQALSYEPDHLSLYELTLEDNTQLMRAVEDGKLHLPQEEEVLAMMEKTTEMLSVTPFIRYEISNHARPGRQCHHNVNYWQNGPYLGLGAAAVSSYNGTRWTGTRKVQDYCRQAENGCIPWQIDDQLDNEACFRETVMIGLRMLQGVNRARLLQRFHIDVATYYGAILERLIHARFLAFDGSWLRLTRKGLPLANTIMAELI
ncbi:MAG: coproporphyrinogen III oxidase [Desulfobulbus propionicus]|nr:MAG: coproporphyrinogen III oxidase [Desulfobulbus propionicus]